ncbi:hypothetical protein J4461_00010 [Candidatus Pacearchaeota archaeon]|nr:hypothetical protein [Candidatus Pacearchaeota archaeon]
MDVGLISSKLTNAFAELNDKMTALDKKMQELDTRIKKNDEGLTNNVIKIKEKFKGTEEEFEIIKNNNIKLIQDQTAEIIKAVQVKARDSITNTIAELRQLIEADLQIKVNNFLSEEHEKITIATNKIIAELNKDKVEITDHLKKVCKEHFIKTMLADKNKVAVPEEEVKKEVAVVEEDTDDVEEVDEDE